MAFEPWQKILASHLEHAVHKCVKMVLVAKGQIAFEDDAIEAAQERNDGRGEAVTKPLGEMHGVLLPYEV
jgi:hypothetical protein